MTSNSFINQIATDGTRTSAGEDEDEVEWETDEDGREMDEDTRTNGECNEFKGKKIQQSNRDRLKGEDEEDRWKINAASRVRRTMSHEDEGTQRDEEGILGYRLHGDTRGEEWEDTARKTLQSQSNHGTQQSNTQQSNKV